MEGDDYVMENEKDTIFTRAEADGTEQLCCDNAFEQTVFLMRDSNHEFTLGLTSVLECIGFAARTGALPKLPKSWCDNVKNELGVEFEKDMYE